MHKVSEEDINAIVQPMELFTQHNNPYSTYLVNAESTPSENHQDNGASPSLCIQSSSPHSPLTNTLVVLYNYLLYPCAEAEDSDILACTADLPEVHLQVSEYILFGVYQYCVHQNPGNHLDGEIT